MRLSKKSLCENHFWWDLASMEGLQHLTIFDPFVNCDSEASSQPLILLSYKDNTIHVSTLPIWFLYTCWSCAVLCGPLRCLVGPQNLVRAKFNTNKVIGSWMFVHFDLDSRWTRGQQQGAGFHLPVSAFMKLLYDLLSFSFGHVEVSILTNVNIYIVWNMNI